MQKESIIDTIDPEIVERLVERKEEIDNGSYARPGVVAALALGSVPIALAALSCFFTTVVGTLLGLKAADRATLDLITVYGGGRFTQLRLVRVIAALPATLNALQIAVPAAFLGAVLGEFFRGATLGVGPGMIAAQQGLNAARVWDIALASGAVALVGYALVGLVARAAAPWSRTTGSTATSTLRLPDGTHTCRCTTARATSSCWPR